MMSSWGVDCLEILSGGNTVRVCGRLRLRGRLRVLSALFGAAGEKKGGRGKMTGMWTVIAAIVSFAAAAAFGIWLVPFLKKIHFGQTIREEGPQWHNSKQGTPIMGGLMFIAASIVVGTLCILMYHAFGVQETPLLNAKIFAGMFMAAAFGAIGFIDDYIKAVKKRNLGLTAVQKLVLQFVVAIAYLITIAIFGGKTETFIPFYGMLDIGIFYYPIAAILIVGIVNAANLTDGIDGLDGSVTFFICIFFMLIASFVSRMGVSIMSAALAGGCLGFLVWNFHPAKVFMGDTGSLYLGGYVCALAFALDMPIMLILMGLVYIIEMFSVILQVLYFKATKGKRLFKMSPIHHHFEMCGWSEVKIVVMFSVFTVICGALAFIVVVNGNYRIPAFSV